MLVGAAQYLQMQQVFFLEESGLLYLMSQQIYKYVLEPTHNKYVFLYLHITFLFISY